MSWRLTSYSRALEEEILRLPAGFAARFLRYVERMEVYGPDLACLIPGPWVWDCSSYALRRLKA